MRRVLLLAAVIGLAACGRGHDRDPKWPERADRDDDGGESIEPKPSAIASASTKDEDKVDETPAVAAAAKPADGATPAAATATPSTTTTTTITAPEEVINLDDIVIEIED